MSRRGSGRLPAVIACAAALAGGLALAGGTGRTQAGGDFARTVERAAPGSSLVAPADRPLRLSLEGRRFDPAVTIRGGTFATVSLVRSSGIHFEGTRFVRDDPADQTPLIFLQGARDIRLTQVVLRGAGQANGLKMLASTDVTIADSAVSNLSNGIRGINLERITIRDTRFADIRADSLAFGGLRHALIANNRFRNLDTEKATHPDALQMWDDATHPSHDVVIRDNRIMALTQGIFVKSEKHGGFDRIAILDNDIVAGYGNGLHLSASRGSRIAGNSVRTLEGGFNMAKIDLRGNVGLVFENNRVCKVNDQNNVFGSRRKIKLNWACKPVAADKAGIP